MTVLTDFYLDRLNMVAKGDASFRQSVVSSLYDRGSTIESKNRALRDIYHLFKGDWLSKLEPDWDFVEINKLLKEPADRKTPPKHIDQQHWNKLIIKIDEAKQRTFFDFDDLKKQFKPFKDPQNYIDWFYLYLPYLVKNLPATPEGWNEAIDRLQWFLKQAPDNTGCPVNILDDAAIDFMTNWYVLENKIN